MADVLGQDERGGESERDRRPLRGSPETRGERDPGREVGGDIAGPFEIIIGAESFGAVEPAPEPESISDSEPAPVDPDLGLPDEPLPRSVAHFGTELLAALVLVGVVGVVVSALVLSTDRGGSGIGRAADTELASLTPSLERNALPAAEPTVPSDLVPAQPLPTVAIAPDVDTAKAAADAEAATPNATALDREEHEAVIAQRHGDNERALAIYERVLQVDPARPLSLNNKGAVLLARGDLPGAIACFEKAERVSPDSPDVQNNLGVAARQGGDHHAAEERFRKALARDPAFTDARFNLALELVDRGAAEEARTCLQPLLALDGLWIVKAEAARLLARLDAEAQPAEAERHLQTAAAIVPEDALLGDLGALHVLARDFDRALTEIERSLGTREDPRVVTNRGVVQLQQGHPEAALEDFDRALALAPDLVEARYDRALACEARGDFLGALSAYEQVLDQLPEHVGARHNLGLLYLRGDRPRDALAMLQAAPPSVQSPALDHLRNAVLERLHQK
jgi:tetratricopeptide (TPR) repeat protein